MAVMTDEKKSAATQLYAAGGMSVSDIARKIGVSQATLSSWFNHQTWYVPKHRCVSRGKKIEAKLKMGQGNIAEANRNNEPNTFVIPWLLPGMNEYIAAINANRQRGAALKRSAENGIVLCAKVGLPHREPLKCKGQVHVHYVERDKKRDFDNIRMGTKFILDALQTAGVIQGDGQSYLLPPTESFGYDKENPRVVVTITPHPEYPITVEKRTATKKAKNELRYMSDGEIVRAYNAAADKNEQIKILAELNAMSRDEIKKIVEGQI